MCVRTAGQIELGGRSLNLIVSMLAQRLAIKLIASKTKVMLRAFGAVVGLVEQNFGIARFHFIATESP